MKRADKLLLFFGSMICLGLSIGVLSIFCPLPFVSDAVNMFRSDYFWSDSLIVGFCVFICVLFLSLLLLSILIPGKGGNLILPKSRGALKFSKQAIESTVKLSFKDVAGITFSQVSANINRNPEKLKIYVKLSLSDLNQLVDLTETVQQRIESVLLSSLGIAAKSINIKVIKYSQNKKAQTESSEDVTAESRVI